MSVENSSIHLALQYFNRSVRETANYYEVVSEEQYYALGEIFSIVTMAIALSGVLTNAACIRTFIKMGLEDGVSITFFTLSLSDFCYTLVTCFQNVAGICAALERKYGRYFFRRIDPMVFILLTANIGMVIYTMTTLTTAFVAVARCMCIAMPFKFKNVFTRRTCLLTIVAFAVFTTALHIPTFTNLAVEERLNPWLNTTRLVLAFSKQRQRIKDVVRVVTFFFLSAISEVIVLVCVFVMTSRLNASVQFRRQQSVQSSEPSDKTPRVKLTGKERVVVLQVISISVIFIVCNLYRMVHVWVELFEPSYDMGGRLQFLYLIIGGFRTTVDCINSSVNFYIYLLWNERFRSQCFSCIKVVKSTKDSKVSS